MAKKEQRRAYVIYDQGTGAVVSTHTAEDAEGHTIKAAAKEIIDLYRSGAPEGEERKLAVLEVDEEPVASGVPLLADPKQGTVSIAPMLRLRADRTELEGDGEDSIDIDVEVVDQRDRVVQGFDGDVVVTTTRGRLSERGGRLSLAKGRGTIRLTTVPETVLAVRVTAMQPEGLAAPGNLDLAFL